MGVIVAVHNPGGRQDDNFFPTAHENMLFYARDISSASLNTLGVTKEKLSQFKYSDKFGNYKLRGFRRSGSNSRREDRPGLFYLVFYNKKTKKISLNKENEDFIKLLPVDENGIERCWRWGPKTLVEKEKIYIEVKETKNGYEMFIKEREDNYKGEKAKTVWNKPNYTGQTGTHELKLIFGDKIFSYPKSPYLISDLLKITTKPNDIVLDFFAGSATTATVAHKMNRQWITVEQMDYVEDISVERLKKVIGKKVKKDGDFIYCELMKYNEAFMDKIQSAKTSEELIELGKAIAQNSFLNWYVNPEIPEEAVTNIVEIGKSENGLEKQKKLLAELLNKNQLYVNLSEIDDEDFAVSEEDRKLNRLFYGESYNG
jgi:adenine-specific DNA-methyltransferase